MERPILNRDLIRHLIRTYYQDSHQQQEDPFISSHWKEYSALIKCVIDDEGIPVSLSGVGFGTYKYSGGFHRIFDSACTLSHLMHLPAKMRLLRLARMASVVCRAMDLDFTFDVFRQVCVLSFLSARLPDALATKENICLLVIGDGFGVFSALLKIIFPRSTIVMIDIGKVLLFQAYFCQKAHPGGVHRLADTAVDNNYSDFVYCPSEHISSIDSFVFDIAINVASMQEMNVSTITAYFSFLRSHLQKANLFYCCNREFKKMPGGEITEFDKYPWKREDRHLVDGYCPWLSYFLSPAKAANSLKLLGTTVPFVHLYASKMRHRLTTLSLEGRSSR